MIYELLVFGGVLFWSIAGLVGLIVAGCIYSDEPKSATIALGLALALTYAFTDVSAFSLPSIWDLAQYGAAYICIGIVWALAKWFMFMRKVRALADEYASLPEGHWGKSTYRKLKEYVRYKCGQSQWPLIQNMPPRASDHTASQFSWLAYWPISLVIFILDKPVRKIFTLLNEGLSGLYNRITASQFDDWQDPNKAGK